MIHEGLGRPVYSVIAKASSMPLGMLLLWGKFVSIVFIVPGVQLCVLSLHNEHRFF